MPYPHQQTPCRRTRAGIHDVFAIEIYFPNRGRARFRRRICPAGPIFRSRRDGSPCARDCSNSAIQSQCFLRIDERLLRDRVRWLDDAREVTGVTGVMYTTWRRDYANVEAFVNAAVNAANGK